MEEIKRGKEKMKKNELDHFNELFKVDILTKLINIDSEGTITRNLLNDYQRTLRFIRYGFEAGIKFERRKNG